MTKFMNLIYKGCFYFVLIYLLFLLISPLISSLNPGYAFSEDIDRVIVNISKGETESSQIVSSLERISAEVKSLQVLPPWPFILYGLFISFTSLLFTIPANKVLQVALHFIAHLIFFWFDLSVMIGFNSSFEARFVVTGTVIFVILYAIVSLIAWPLRKLMAVDKKLAEKKKEEAYTKQFKK